MEISQETLNLLKGFEVTKQRKFHDFQIAGKVISDFLGTPAYFLFSKYDHDKIREAFFIAEKSARNDKKYRNIKYLVGIIKKLR